MQATMLVQTMMQATGDGGVRDNCNVYGHDVNHCFTLHPKLWQGQSQNSNPNKGQGFGKAIKGKVRSTKGRPLNQLKANPTPWRLGLHGWRPQSQAWWPK